MPHENVQGLIYKTTNLVNQKIYIGQTVQIKRYLKGKYLGSGSFFKKAIKKYGLSNFLTEVLCYTTSSEELDSLEKYYIKLYNSLVPVGYNLAEGGHRPKQHSLTTLKSSLTRLGVKTGPCTEQRKQNIQKARLKTLKHSCSYCLKVTDPGNYKRFHGDNCKLNPNINPEVLLKRSTKSRATYLLQREKGNYSKPKLPKGLFSCPYCSKIGSNYGNMKRFHFDRCKLKQS